MPVRSYALSNEEKEQLSKLGLDDSYFKKQTGAIALFGENGFSPIERIGARPTLDINGIIGGYTGVGPKTVIPSKCLAKLSMRLVPNQSPKIVYEQLKDIFAESELNFFEVQTIITWVESDTLIALANLTVDYRMEEKMPLDERRDVV